MTLRELIRETVPEDLLTSVSLLAIIFDWRGRAYLENCQKRRIMDEYLKQTGTRVKNYPLPDVPDYIVPAGEIIQ